MRTRPGLSMAMHSKSGVSRVFLLHCAIIYLCSVVRLRLRQWLWGGVGFSAELLIMLLGARLISQGGSIVQFFWPRTGVGRRGGGAEERRRDGGERRDREREREKEREREMEGM